MILATLKEAIRITKSRRAAKADAKDRARLAKLFNDRYCYRNLYVPDAPRLESGTAMYGIMPSSGNAWMCPECNHVWMVQSCSAFSGLQFPSCCGTPQGHRLDQGIRTR